MQYSYIPKGTCSRLIEFDLDNETIHNLKVTGGCNGNLKGISALLEGANAKDVISRIKGTDCNGKGTSCPDQIARALEQALSQQ